MKRPLQTPPVCRDRVLTLATSFENAFRITPAKHGATKATAPPASTYCDSTEMTCGKGCCKRTEFCVNDNCLALGADPIGLADSFCFKGRRDGSNVCIMN